MTTTRITEKTPERGHLINMPVYTVEAARDRSTDEYGHTWEYWLIRVALHDRKPEYQYTQAGEKLEVAGMAIDLIETHTGAPPTTFAITVTYLDSVPNQWCDQSA